MKKKHFIVAISLIMCIICAYTFSQIALHATGIKDVNAPTKYYQNAEECLKELKLIFGYPDGEVKSNNYITRAEMTTLCVRLLNVNENWQNGYTPSKIYPDTQNHWAENYISKAYEHKVAEGYPDGLFRPDENITYVEALKMILASGGHGLDKNGNPLEWKEGYKNKAKELNMTEYITCEDDKPISRGAIILMIYEMLCSEIEAPTISIESGTYESKQTVKITSKVENAEIYYTLDGTDPIENGILYTKWLTVDKTATLKAVVIKDRLHSEAIEKDYKITSIAKNNTSNKNNNSIIIPWWLDSQNEKDEYFTVTFVVTDILDLTDKEIEFYNSQTPKVQYVKKGEYAIEPSNPIPARDIDIFNGWYMDEHWKTKFSFDMPITSDITLYSSWTTKDRIISEQNLLYVSDIFLNIEEKYTNNNGYVEYKDYNNLIEEISLYAENLLSNNKIIDYYTNEDNVFIYLLGGGIYVYMPTNHEMLGTVSETLEILTFEPDWNDDKLYSRKDISYYPDSISILYSNIFSRNTITSNYYNQDVTMDNLINLKGDIIIWYGHGGYDEDKYGSFLLTTVKKSEEIERKYMDKIGGRFDKENEYEIIYNVDEDRNLYYAVTKNFFANNMADNSLKGSLIYLNACHSLRDIKLAQVFIDKGASVVIGNDNRIGSLHSSYILENVMINLISTTLDGNLYTVKDAINMAIKECEKNRDISFIGMPTFYGNGDYKLSLLGTVIGRELIYDGIKYEIITENDVKIMGVSETKNEYWIPDTIEYNNKDYRVVEIADNAFGEALHGAKIKRLSQYLIKIGKWAFAYNDLSECIFPNTINYIGEGAFCCSTLPSTFALKGNITYGESNVFTDVKNVEYLYIDDKFTIDIKDLFSCKDLKEVIVDKNNSMYKSLDGVLYSKDETVLYLYPPKKSGSEFTVPNGVKTIGYNAFYHTSLEKIVYPLSVEKIELYCMIFNDNLKEIIIENSQAIINTSAMLKNSEQLITVYGYENSTTSFFVNKYNSVYNYYKVKLQFSPIDKEWEYKINSDGITATITRYFGQDINVTIPSTIDGYKVTHIGEMSFYQLIDIESVVIPNGITEIGNSAFELCNELKNINIPDSIIKIGEYAFAACYSLNTITLPDTITEIGEGAFSYSGISTINIPNSLKIIETYVFWECSNLVSLTIPSNVIRIKTYAFADCINLLSVIIKNPMAVIELDAFINAHDKLVITITDK